MKKSIKRITLAILVTGAVFSNTFISLAAWEQSEQGWKYKDDGKGVYLVNGWHWLDGNNDGISECYYLDSAGIMAVNTMVDNYTINADGQWTVDNVVQTQQNSEAVNNTSIQESYLKTEIIECMGKNRAYVENKFGTPNRESDLRDSITLAYNDFTFFYNKSTGLVDSVSAKNLSAICNTLNGEKFNWDDSLSEGIREITREMGEPQYIGALHPYWSFYVDGHEYWLVVSMGVYLIM